MSIVIETRFVSPNYLHLFRLYMSLMHENSARHKIKSIVISKYCITFQSRTHQWRFWFKYPEKKESTASKVYRTQKYRKRLEAPSSLDWNEFDWKESQ